MRAYGCPVAAVVFPHTLHTPWRLYVLHTLSVLLVISYCFHRAFPAYRRAYYPTRADICLGNIWAVRGCW